MDVKWRLVWLRHEHPDAAVATEEIAHDPGKWATFRASVAVPGGGSATGHGSETAGDFGDYYEKAETKALGRALAALGYGAQFLPDDGEALADSPVERPVAPTEKNRTQRPNPPETAQATQTEMVGENPGVVSWTVCWDEARRMGVRSAEDYEELTGRKIPETPQHALNLLRKTIRERDAALSGSSS